MNRESEGAETAQRTSDQPLESTNSQELVRTAAHLVDLMMSLGRLERVAAAH
jgi:hypothetical protein